MGALRVDCEFYSKVCLGIVGPISGPSFIE